MLKVKDLNVFYGGIHAIRGIDVNVKKGEIVTIIGSNGAGKSSMLNAISGVIKYQGHIEYNGQPLSTHAHSVVKSGICQVPEGRVIFANLTVHENLKMGAYLRNDTKGINADFERVYELFPRLKEREKQIAGTLSGGEQQRVALARALVNRPNILLADEPTGNLDPKNSLDIMKLLEEINERGTTVLVVTHNREIVNSFKKRVITMRKGVIVSDEQEGEYLED